jgi:hypothetical protein
MAVNPAEPSDAIQAIFERTKIAILLVRRRFRGHHGYFASARRGAQPHGEEEGQEKEEEQEEEVTLQAEARSALRRVPDERGASSLWVLSRSDR